ncbi:MAG: ComF family protein [Spirochaetaceae bacterium]|jgi:ComF family protein|nr:ComF family protein [Spirochaetaceae bacterium]
MNRQKSLSAVIREWLFPSGCPVCGKLLLDAREARYGLCGDCKASFSIEGENRCSLCGRPLISEQDRCLPCREGEGRYFDRAFAIFPYRGKYQKVLRAYKFGQFRSLGNFFAEKLTESLSFFPLEGLKDPCWVPVPPRPGKLRRYGWDQVAYLARLLEKQYREQKPPPGALPVYHCLKRFSSQTQKGLTREKRKTNLRGRIRCTRKPPPAVFLFDDVTTTGFTLDACAAALKEGGAEKVYGISLFYD